MITRQQADQAVCIWLDLHEAASVDFDSPLPEHDASQRHKLVVVRVDEHDFGWVYFYDSSRHVETGDEAAKLVGNSPLIVGRADGKLYATGTVHPLEHYLEEFRRGKRERA